LDKFVPWFREKCKEFVENKTKNTQEQQLTLIIMLIKGEFYKRYLEICPDKERDMAICPSCETCTYIPDYNLFQLAVDFIIKFDYPIWDNDFSLGDIKPKYFDDFFNENINDFA
jgi:hypothetical protein